MLDTLGIILAGAGTVLCLLQFGQEKKPGWFGAALIGVALLIPFLRATF